MKIGITYPFKGKDDSIWTNGIKLNILILVETFKRISSIDDVFLLGYGGPSVSEGKPYYLEDIDVYDYMDKYMDCDLIIVMGHQVPEDTLLKFKKSGNKKVVSYKCGNNYIILLENILFREDTKNNSPYENIYDEVWYVPQQHDTNYGYYTTLYRSKSITVPFLWYPKFLLNGILDVEKSFAAGALKKGYKYIPTEKKRIGIMEPNINVVKHCLIPLLIAEESYRGEGKNFIDSVYISNVNDTLHKNEFMNVVRSLDLHADKKVSVESRYQTAYSVSQFFDVIISHQLLNPLNYLYLDVVYMGYPILHNAPMCKDIGYFYNQSNTVEAAKQLNWILKNHDNHIEEYRERNNDALYRYHIENPAILEAHEILLHNLFNGGNDVDLKYNPETNLYDNLTKNKTVKKEKVKKTKRKK